MSLVPGTRLGPYEIIAPIGAGGMGEVYRAKDTKLNRDVAIKVLPDSFALDADRVARFTREAQVLASLNHPNIAAIYGIEQHALVMELVDGDDLSVVIARGPLPITDALPIAKQIAEALEAAHELGVVHRDLKPANIKVRRDGTVKVLDFGLAKAMDPAGASSVDAMNSPTLTAHATQMGMIIGTAAYMSPEQARGKAVDRRADIWAFGVVLYEMLTGRRAFEGEDISVTLANVIKEDPKWDALPKDLPSRLTRLLRRCLEKDPKKRLRDIGEARLTLDTIIAGVPDDAAGVVAASVPSRTLPRRSLAVAFLLGAATVGGALWFTTRERPSATPAPVSRTLIGVAPADELGGEEGRPTRQEISLSPNGQVLVFSALKAGRRQIYQRPLDRLDATPVAGTEDGEEPFFSPDSQWVGYWVKGELRKIPLVGGPSIPICKIPARPPYGVSWGSDDRIVFGLSSGGLWQVSAAGGTPDVLTEIDTAHAEVGHRLPYVLPGGDAVLYTITRNRFPRWDETDVAVYSRRTRHSVILIKGGADARYVSTGHLVYAREGAMMAAPFDPSRLAVTGQAVGMMSNLMQSAYHSSSAYDSGAAQLSIAETGAAAYVSGGVFPALRRSLVVVDRSGRTESVNIPRGALGRPRLSPDGERFALDSTGRDQDVWLGEFRRGTFSRLTTTGRNAGPVWTPDGRRVAYRSAQAGPDNLFLRPVDGGEPERLTTSPRHQVPGAWSPDGKVLAFYEFVDETGNGVSQIWLLPMDTRQPKRLTGGAFNEGGADFSPDGRWVAYSSNESNHNEVYVQPYPGPGGRMPISTDGGQSPVWRRDGRELFYLKPLPDGAIQVMSVALTTTPTLRAGVPQVLFRGSFVGGTPAGNFDVMPDGQHFLMIRHDDRPAMPVTQIVLVQNWFDELRRIVPVKK